MERCKENYKTVSYQLINEYKLNRGGGQEIAINYGYAGRAWFGVYTRIHVFNVIQLVEMEGEGRYKEMRVGREVIR